MKNSQTQNLLARTRTSNKNFFWQNVYIYIKCMSMCHVKKTLEIGQFPNLPVKSENDEFC